MNDAVAVCQRYQPEICAWLESHGVANTSGMKRGGTQSVCGMEVTLVRADPSSGFTVYHAGDTALELGASF